MEATKAMDWLLDEDDLSVAFIRVSHVDSDNEAPSDVGLLFLCWLMIT